jgi:hypothetical protein
LAKNRLLGVDMVKKNAMNIRKVPTSAKIEELFRKFRKIVNNKKTESDNNKKA